MKIFGNPGNEWSIRLRMNVPEPANASPFHIFHRGFAPRGLGPRRPAPASCPPPSAPVRLLQIIPAADHASRLPTAAASSPVAPPIARPSVAAPATLDAEILALLEARPMPGEPCEAAFRRKEHELGALFGTLSIAEAEALQRRLSNPAKDDLLATRFTMLLVHERRQRLIGFLVDAHRRAAITATRGK